MDVIDEYRKPKIKRPLQWKIERAEKICELYSIGCYTIQSCCAVFGVKYSTFQYWAQPNKNRSENVRRGFVRVVHEMYLRAKIDNRENYLNSLREAVRIALLSRASGITYLEVQTTIMFDEEGNHDYTFVRKVNKYIPPDVRLLIFVSKNLIFK